MKPFASIVPISEIKVLNKKPLCIFAELSINKYAATKNSAFPLHWPRTIGCPNKKIPAMHGIKIPAVEKRDVRATVSLFIAAKLNPVDATIMSPEKAAMKSVVRLQQNPLCAINISKSPRTPLKILV